jgi:hypothetical protein
VVLNILDQAVRYEEGMGFARLAIDTGAGHAMRGGAEWLCWSSARYIRGFDPFLLARPFRARMALWAVTTSSKSLPSCAHQWPREETVTSRILPAFDGVFEEAFYLGSHHGTHTALTPDSARRRSLSR